MWVVGVIVAGKIQCIIVIISQKNRKHMPKYKNINTGHTFIEEAFSSLILRLF